MSRSNKLTLLRQQCHQPNDIHGKANKKNAISKRRGVAAATAKSTTSKRKLVMF